MSAPIEFYFDFSSPYAYFASHGIDAVAAEFGRPCLWKPMLLGPAFKASGSQRLVDQPLKGAYALHDWLRLGRMLNLPYRHPDPFPVATTAAARVFWWLDATDSARAKAFARAVFAAYFAEGRNISDEDVVAGLADGQGQDRQSALDAMRDPRWKDRCRAETEAAIARGVFGAPFFFVDGEGFWGSDRLEMVRSWLVRGGW
jgi:2-hydroxychromene-2-carboxylate isomerase